MVRVPKKGRDPDHFRATIYPGGGTGTIPKTRSETRGIRPNVFADPVTRPAPRARTADLGHLTIVWTRIWAECSVGRTWEDGR
jgi:hypothetical protein